MLRRCLLLLIACGAIGSNAVAQSELAERLQPLIDAHPGSVAVAVKHLDRDVSFAYRAEQPMPTASLIKLPIMVEAYRQAAAGKIDLATPVTLRDEDKVPGSGVLTYHFSAGAQISLRDAIRLMIAYSDNTATNLVIDQIGLPSTSAFMRQLGCPNTQLHAKVFRRDTSIAPERSQQFGLGSTTAGEMIRLLEMLATGELASADATQAMFDHLYACDDRTKFPRYLPTSTKVAHKTGAVAQSRTDAGILETDAGRILLCVLTDENEDKSWSDDNQANVFCSRIAQAVFEHFQPATPNAGKPTELVVGVQGELVESLQRTLNARLSPGPELSVDGDFGPQTEKAVIEFQQAQGIPAHGRVDQATWEKLGTLIESDTDEIAAPEIVNQQSLPQEPVDPIQSAPFVTCRAWGIADIARDEMLWGHNETTSLDPASTTKIMTALVALRMAGQTPELLSKNVVFSENADSTIGSTAGLRAGEYVTLREALFGLLLPSGNDAAVAIAEFLGQQLPAVTRDAVSVSVSAEQGGADSAATPATPVDDSPLVRFVAEMNRTARELGMQETSYRNPHGLTAEGHMTSVRDLIRVAREAVRDPLFREVVATQQRGAIVGSQSGYQRNIVWKNTNRLLGTEGYGGIKTGTTQAAGACLVSLGKRDDRELIIVVLGSESSAGRYADTRNLFRWAWQQLAESSERDNDGSVPVRSGPVVVSQQARRLHSASLLVDGHNDLPWRMRTLGTTSFSQVDIARLQPQLHTDIPRLRQGNVGAQFWSVYVPVDYSDRGAALLTTLEQIDFVHRMIETYPETFQLALTSDDIRRARAEGKIASLIGVEGGHCIENSLNVLRQLHQRGARYMTLTHSSTLDWADSATDHARHGGLTAFGEEVVREMNRLGMLVDISHVSIETMKDALELSKAPVIFSHSSARAVADHPRNVPDEVLRLLPENGGVVMVNFYSAFVVPSAAKRSVEMMARERELKDAGASEEEIKGELRRMEVRQPLDAGSIYNVVDHIDHIVRVAGIDHVGIGSDYDGIDAVPRQLEDVSTYPRLTQELLNRGYTDQQIRKILGERMEAAAP
jgi:microsomal dipeptidase-like Zn-dependent dipeptidase/beta-lactamase class A